MPSNRLLRVMHVVVGGDIGGAERLLTEIARRPELTGAEHQAAVITPNRALVEFLESFGVHVHDRGPARENPLAYLARSFGPADVAWLSGLLARESIDIVHTHTFGSHVLGTRAAQRRGLPQVRTEHDFVHYVDPSCSPFTRWAASRTRRLVAVSAFVGAEIARLAPAVASRLSVVRNGVDTAYWSPRPAARRDAIDADAPPPWQREGTAGAPLLAGIFCRLASRKRVHLAIEAAALAGVSLIVAGEGQERPRLEALAAHLGARVTFAGRHSDPRPLIAQCDVTLSTSDREPLGLSVLESLAMERPVVGFASGGVVEIVEDGVTGWLVRESTGRALGAAVARAREERARLPSMGAAARRFVTDACSIEAMCAGYADVYRALVRNPP